MNSSEQLRGVNLGGWLVLEKWLTESLFVGTDAWNEYDFMRTSGAKAKIERHRKTFITEEDFEWLQLHGVNSVRIPVGYWLFEAQDGYTPTVQYLDWAMEMAEKYGLKVLIDLHAAPGGQNRGDHSGKGGDPEWFDDENRAKTIEIFKKIAKRYRDSPALWGIELLNEPESRGQYLTLLKFYRLAYAELCGILHPGTYVVFHDGFRPLLFTGAIWARKSHPVVMDVHRYAFSIGKFRRMDRYVRYLHWQRRILVRILQLWQPVIVGEWSAVLPQELFDKAPQSNHKAMLTANVASQQKAYKAAKGWMYWNYKAEGRGMWHFRSLIEDGTVDGDVL
jgi:glucan 1,3-beta-glucosidase